MLGSRLAAGSVGLLLALAPHAALAAEPNAAGVWKQIDGDTGKVGALVEISEQNGVFNGRLVQIFPDPGDDPNPICKKCEGERHNAPLVGLVFIEGMKRHGLEYDDGTILDPDSGDIYDASMKLSPDGNKLTVSGYVGLSIFGGSQTWVRAQ